MKTLTVETSLCAPQITTLQTELDVAETNISTLQTATSGLNARVFTLETNTIVGQPAADVQQNEQHFVLSGNKILPPRCKAWRQDRDRE